MKYINQCLNIFCFIASTNDHYFLLTNGKKSILNDSTGLGNTSKYVSDCVRKILE